MDHVPQKLACFAGSCNNGPSIRGWGVHTATHYKFLVDVQSALPGDYEQQLVRRLSGGENFNNPHPPPIPCPLPPEVLPSLYLPPHLSFLFTSKCFRRSSAFSSAHTYTRTHTETLFIHLLFFLQSTPRLWRHGDLTSWDYLQKPVLTLCPVHHPCEIVR